VVWSRKVKADAGYLFDLGILVKLGTIVSGDGFEFCGLSLEQLDASVVQRAGRPIVQLADHHISRFALYDRDDAVFRVRAHDGIIST